MPAAALATETLDLAKPIQQPLDLVPTTQNSAPQPVEEPHSARAEPKVGTQNEQKIEQKVNLRPSRVEAKAKVKLVDPKPRTEAKALRPRPKPKSKPLAITPQIQWQDQVVRAPCAICAVENGEQRD